MKLYTESQVLNMLNMTDEVVNGDLYTYDEIIKSQTPIELPNRDMADEASLTKSVESKIDFINGFIWTCSYVHEYVNKEIK